MIAIQSPRRVLCISGHDPSGGAGLQADIEAVAAQGAHALGIVTALTTQDTQNVRRVRPVAAAVLAEQIDLLLADCTVHAIKLGLIGDADQVPVIVGAIEQCAVPVVLDPVLRAGGGGQLAGSATAQALLEELLPRALVATPNAAEARRLAAPAADPDDCARVLRARGCSNLLITGGDEDTAAVENRWYHADGMQLFRWPRLVPRVQDHSDAPSGFHGAGCTLAAALAARLALGEPLATALDEAQRYVHGCLEHALQIGRGRAIPNRFPHRRQP
jgi:hydroxymethylpyrimidine/phosphomethylpyrimidine kinase